MKTNKIAVIQFPGSNCEYETHEAIRHYAMESDIVRWNTPSELLRQYSGYVLPGGFSYQDRIRSGAIAARLPILSVLFEANTLGKPILGICNGCQILSETGLVPHTDPNDSSHSIEIALTHNEINHQRIGFKCDWTFVRVTQPEKSIFTRYFDTSDVIPIPINHGEGRFVLSDTARAALPELSVFQYCNSDGAIDNASNPNGTTLNIAGIANKKGNVLAIMPHPERAALLKQIPDWLPSSWATNKTHRLHSGFENGPWEKLFVAMKEYMAQKNGVIS